MNKAEFDSENKVMKYKVFCTLCTAKIWEKFYNGTTNLSSHIKCTHANNDRVKAMLKSPELLVSERWEDRIARAVTVWNKQSYCGIRCSSFYRGFSAVFSTLSGRVSWQPKQEREI